MAYNVVIEIGPGAAAAARAESARADVAALVEATAADAEAAAADAEATAADAEATAADVLLTGADVFASAASAALAQGYAQTAEDTTVPNGAGYSALHYAAKAAASAALADSEGNATIAQDSAAAALVSETNAAGHEAGAEAARDLAETYAGVDHRAATWAALSAISGLAGDVGYVPDEDTGTHTDPIATGTVDNAGVYVWAAGGLGSAQAERVGDTGLAGKVDTDILYAVAQAIGPATADMGAGTGSAAGNNAYWYANPVTVEGGDRVRFTAYMNASGTVRIVALSKSGNDYTVEDYVDVDTASGLNSFIVDGLVVEDGQYLGFAVSTADIAIQAGTDATTGGYYSASGATPAVSDVLTDATASALVIMARFDIEIAYVTGGRVKALSDAVDSMTYPLGLSGEDQNVGRPEGETLVTGSTAGTSHYIFEGEADGDRYLESIDIYATSAGFMSVGAWSTDGSGDVARERYVTLEVEAGLNQFTDTGLALLDGEKLGVQRGSAGIAITTASGGDQTPYRSISSTSGTPSAVSNSIRFELIATLSPNSLPVRVTRIEDEQAANPSALLTPHTFHALWMLGESHCAGRGETLSGAIIPAGSGYCYRRASGEMVALADPTGNDSTAIASGGKGSWGPAAGRAVLDASRGAIGAAVVNSGLGSSTIVTDWASGGSGWTQALADWADAKSEMDTDGIPACGCSVVIAIGSNDAAAGTAKATFKAGIIDLIGRVRTELGYDVPVLILPTGPFDDGSYSTEVAYIQAAQHEIAKEETNVRLITTATEYAASLGWFVDNVHFAQVANEAIGAALGVTASAVGTGLPV